MLALPITGDNFLWRGTAAQFRQWHDVLGDDYMESTYGYHVSNKWKNIGYIFAFMVILCGIYLVATGFITEKKSEVEIFIFRRGHKSLKRINAKDDLKGGNDRDVAVANTKTDDIAIIEQQTAIFQWKDVCYDIKIKKRTSQDP